MIDIKLHETLHQQFLLIHKKPKFLLGVKEWRINGKLHREDGPAIEYANGDKYWYINGLLHREDGPACERADGYKSWYYQGKKIYCKDNQEFLRMIKLMIFL